MSDSEVTIRAKRGLSDGTPGLLVRHPAISLSAIVAGSCVFRFLGALKIRNPWILPDEFIYSELAKGIANHGELLIRGVTTHRYPPVYPLLISPAYLVRNPHLSYALTKGINAALMSLAAVPTYLLARRTLTRGFALVAAALAVSIPSMNYTGVIMTENAFYPIFLLTFLFAVRALEMPTRGRQIVAIAAFGVAALTRPQAVALVVGYFSAIALLAFARGEVRRTLGAFRFTFGVLGAILAAAICVQAVRGGPPSSILGFYASTVHRYAVAAIAKWVLYHLVDLELLVAVIPFVAAFATLPSIVSRAKNSTAGAEMYAVALGVGAWTIVLAAALSASRTGPPGYPPLPPHLHERYLFYLAPLFFIAFLAWLQSPEQRAGRKATLIAAGAAIALPLTLPYSKLLTNIGSEAPTLIPWRNVPATSIVMAVFAGLMTTLLLYGRRVFVMAQIGLVLVVITWASVFAAGEMESASAAVPTSFPHDRSWIDERVQGAHVVIIWQTNPRWSASTLRYRQQALWNSEFFNASLGGVYYVGQPMQFGLPQTRLETDARLVGSSDQQKALAQYQYALATSNLPLRGDVVARDARAGLVLFRLARPLRLQ